MRDNIGNQQSYLTADEAVGVLSVSRQTLYAYASRGLIRSIRQVGSKQKLYYREDVEKVRSRSQARAGHGAVAASAMDWGEPIIQTTITEITPAGPRYRGRLATNLVRTGGSFEAVTELLWTGIWQEDPLRWDSSPLPDEISKFIDAMPPLQSNDQLLEVFALVTLQLGMLRGTVSERLRAGRTLEAAREIIQMMVGCFGLLSRKRRYCPVQAGQSISEGLLNALEIKASEENKEAIEAALILFADHELSPGAFAARLAASSGAALHSCIASAIATSTGVQIGRMYDQIEEFLADATDKEALLRRAHRYLESRNDVPSAFGHRLYPQGDPRSLKLIEIVKQHSRQSKQLEAIYGFLEDARTHMGLFPRHELAVIALVIALGLPKHCGGPLFVLARTAGWVAHVQEQRLIGLLLRPRAKFIGVNIPESLT